MGNYTALGNFSATLIADKEPEPVADLEKYRYFLHPDDDCAVLVLDRDYDERIPLLFFIHNPFPHIWLSEDATTPMYYYRELDVCDLFELPCSFVAGRTITQMKKDLVVHRLCELESALSDLMERE